MACRSRFRVLPRQFDWRTGHDLGRDTTATKTIDITSAAVLMATRRRDDYKIIASRCERRQTF